MRRGNGGCGGIFGGGGGGGGGRAAAETKQLGGYDEEPEEKLAPRETPYPTLHFWPARDTSGSGSSERLANEQRGRGGGGDGGGLSGGGWTESSGCRRDR